MESHGKIREAGMAEILKRIVKPTDTTDITDFLSNLSPKPEYESREVNSVEDVIKVIKEAKENGQIVRAHGSNHSPQDKILGIKENGILLTLKGDLAEITALANDGTSLIVEAGGGGYLGKRDRSDNGGTLCKVIDDLGYAAPILGGITRQTVSGFMLTGSAGGSLKHGFADCIIGIEFVDGNGQKQNCGKDGPNKELFEAVGVSMGLFGIITKVTFEFKDKKYLVDGAEEHVGEEDSFLKDAETLRKSIEDNDYSRLNWFPQQDCKKVMQWKGNRVPYEGNDVVPYKHPLQCWVVALGAAGALMTCNSLLYDPKPCPNRYQLIGWLLNQFLKGDKQKFRDDWYRALPMDDQADVECLIRVDFTEIWVPMSQCGVVLEKLKGLYSEDEAGQLAAGSFATEIYSAKESPFWLSMSYGSNMLRVDPFWYHWNCIVGRTEQEKRDYFGFVWDVLLGIDGARLHWGKYLPLPGQTCGDVTFNLERLKTVYKKMVPWLSYREQMDPDQVFVNAYWRGILEIPDKK